MTKGLSEEKARWLTYLVYIILTFQAGNIVWLVAKQVEMPDKFVRLERYTKDQEITAERYSCDMERIEKALDSINGKLDRGIFYHEGR